MDYTWEGAHLTIEPCTLGVCLSLPASVNRSVVKTLLLFWCTEMLILLVTNFLHHPDSRAVMLNAIYYAVLCCNGCPPT